MHGHSKTNDDDDDMNVQRQRLNTLFKQNYGNGAILSQDKRYVYRYNDTQMLKALPRALKEAFFHDPDYRAKKRTGGTARSGKIVHRYLSHRVNCKILPAGCECDVKTHDMPRKNSPTLKCMQQAFDFENDYNLVPILSEFIVAAPSHTMGRVATRVDCLCAPRDLLEKRDFDDACNNLTLVSWKTGHNKRSINVARCARKSPPEYRRLKAPFEHVTASESAMHQLQLFGEYMLMTRHHKINIKDAYVVYLGMDNNDDRYYVRRAEKWWFDCTRAQQDQMWRTFVQLRHQNLRRHTQLKSKSSPCVFVYSS